VQGLRRGGAQYALGELQQGLAVNAAVARQRSLGLSGAPGSGEWGPGGVGSLHGSSSQQQQQQQQHDEPGKPGLG
jgi:hypothetical protein